MGGGPSPVAKSWHEGPKAEGEVYLRLFAQQKKVKNTLFDREESVEVNSQISFSIITQKVIV